jgi:hypothetical protein
LATKFKDCGRRLTASIVEIALLSRHHYFGLLVSHPSQHTRTVQPDAIAVHLCTSLCSIKYRYPSVGTVSLDKHVSYDLDT